MNFDVVVERLRIALAQPLPGASAHALMAPRPRREWPAGFNPEAIRHAGEGDIVLIAGKGHEDYQQVGDTRLPYSDRDAVQELLGRVA